MNKINMSIIIYLILTLIFYLAGSFINLSFNFINWGTFSRIIYTSGAIISLKLFLKV